MNIQTRLPAHLWESLQDVFYEQDVAFLRAIAPHIQVPFAELKRTLLGARGQLTTVQIADSEAWWERSLCPLRHRDAQGIWRQCGAYREAGGFCRKHRDFWNPSADLKHKDDPWFQNLPKRVPWRYEGRIVWVDESGVFEEDGKPVLGVRICTKTGVATVIDSTEEST